MESSGHASLPLHASVAVSPKWLHSQHSISSVHLRAHFEHHMDASALVRLALLLGRVGGQLSATETGQAHRLSQAIQHGMRARWEELVREHPDDVILTVYMSDGWGADTASHHRVPLGLHTVVRAGKLRHEFLLQRGLIRVYRRDGEVLLAQQVFEPVGLAAGRTALHCFTAICSGAPLSRHLGAKGICISAYILMAACFLPSSATCLPGI